MDTTSNGHLVLELLRSFDMKAGDGLLLDALRNMATIAGASLDEFENSIISASANGWVLVAAEMVHLTSAGFLISAPANDN